MVRIGSVRPVHSQAERRHDVRSILSHGWADANAGKSAPPDFNRDDESWLMYEACGKSELFKKRCAMLAK